MMGGECQPASFRAASVAAAMLLTIFVMTPMAAPAVVPAAALVIVVGFSAEAGRMPWARPSRLFVGLAIVGGYLLVNCSWSHAPSSAFAAVGFYFVLVIGALLAVQALNDSSEGRVHAIALGICIGVALGTVFFCFEIFSSQSVRRTLMSYVPSLRAKAPEVQVEGDWITSMPAYLLNRNAAALSLCLWPTLLMIGQVRAGSWRKALLYAAVGGGALAIVASDHETSKLACIGGALIYAISRFSLSAARRLTVVGWTAATLLVVPVSTFAYSQGLYLASWLPSTAQHRVIIWSYIAEQVASAPVLGVGINSTRAISAQTGDGAEVAPGSKYIRITKSHSHSIYLQAWYETGAVGAGMLFVLGLLLLQSLRSAPERMHAHLYAAFVTGALVAASSFSLWAMWFMASFALAAMLAFVGICLGQKAQRETIDSNRAPGTDGSLTEGMRV